jgi:hypothetical protein
MRRLRFGMPRGRHPRRFLAATAASTTTFLAAAALTGLAARPAQAIINGTNVADNFMLQVGHVFNAGNTSRGTGTHIYSDLLRPGSVSFVLTAAHVNASQYRPGGATGNGGNLINSNAQFTHRNFLGPGNVGLTEDNDLALLRFDTPLVGVPTSNLFRGVFNRGLLPVVGNSMELVAYDGTFAGAQKKRGTFQIDQVSPNNVKAQFDHPVPPPVEAITQGGDSGGPYFQPTAAGNAIAGVHDSGDNATFSANTILRNVTPGLRYLDWIDSHTRRAVFWDNLRTTTGLLDGFEADTGQDGLADGWTSVQVNHPILGQVGLDPNWTDIEGIGSTAQALFTEGARAQGNWVDTVQLDTGNVISKTFNLSSALDLTVDYRWNSLSLWTDMGIQVGNGPINWRGISVAQLGNLDMPLAFQGSSGAGGNVTVYLLTAVSSAPEPGTLSLLVVAFGTTFGGIVRRRLRA